MKQSSLCLPQQLPAHEQTLIKKIVQDYPEVTFRVGSRFAFRPPHSVILGPYEPNYLLLFLHELGHFLTQHYNFSTDIERLKIEREAWDHAKKICTKYKIPYDEDFAETQLDSYRDWLHTKSKCPKCGLTRYQTKNGQYHCPHCDLTV